MKPMFGIDVTTNKANEEINGKQLVARTIDDLQMKEFEKHSEELAQTIQNANLPTWLNLIKIICGYLAILVAVIITRKAFEIGLAQAYENAPIIFIGTFICALVWLTLFLISRKKQKAVMEGGNLEHKAASIDRDINDLYEMLGVPLDATSVDILMFRYKQKSGEPIAQAKGFMPTPYVNVDLKMFATENALCIADLQELYKIPKTAFRGIKTVNKRIPIMNWNKKEAYNKGQYKQYKMTKNGMDMIVFKPYHVLEFELEGELWGIYFPCYELECFERLTGLYAEKC